MRQRMPHASNLTCSGLQTQDQSTLPFHHAAPWRPANGTHWIQLLCTYFSQVKGPHPVPVAIDNLYCLYLVQNVSRMPLPKEFVTGFKMSKMTANRRVPRMSRANYAHPDHLNWCQNQQKKIHFMFWTIFHRNIRQYIMIYAILFPPVVITQLQWCTDMPIYIQCRHILLFM